MASPGWKNKLFFGDNLTVLREEIDPESVDLVYLDPPFNSNASYNVLFAEKSGEKSSAQIRVFDDTWHWGIEAEVSFRETMQSGGKLADLLHAMRGFLGQNDMMAYLVMMAPRLRELHRVLKPTGSIYLHCDPTASHYLKLLMDAIFGARHYINEITWKRTTAHNDAKQGRKAFGNVADILLLYAKSSDYIFHFQHGEYSSRYLKKYRNTDPDGRQYRLDNLTGPGGAAKGNPAYELMGVTRYWRYSKTKMDDLLAQGRIVQTRPGSVPQYKRYLDEMLGVPVQNIWDNISPINSQAQERLGYPTQKPEALLERVVKTSSNEGDVILDAFCGCGTAISVAERLERRWIGIDVTHLAIALIRHRLRFAFRGQLSPYEVKGTPTDLAGAVALAKLDRYQFEWWALGLVDARPAHDKKKGADKGIDGHIYFISDLTGELRKAVVQVKSGHVMRSMIGDLNHARQRERAEIAILLTLEKPTAPMKQEAATAGIYQPPEQASHKIPRVQILTIEELLSGKRPELPRLAQFDTFRKPPRAEKGTRPEQGELFRKRG